MRVFVCAHALGCHGKVGRLSFHLACGALVWGWCVSHRLLTHREAAAHLAKLGKVLLLIPSSPPPPAEAAPGSSSLHVPFEQQQLARLGGGGEMKILQTEVILPK